MDDKIIKTNFSFVDTETGQVFSKGNKLLPLSNFTSDSISNYVQSFLRGVKLNKPIAIEIVLSVSDNKKPCELKISFDLEKPIITSQFLNDVH